MGFRRLGAIKMVDALGNKSLLVVDAIDGGAMKYCLGIEALSNLGVVAHHLPRCYAPGVFEKIVSMLQHAQGVDCYRDVCEVEQPVADAQTPLAALRTLVEAAHAVLESGQSDRTDDDLLNDLAAGVAEAETVMR